MKWKFWEKTDKTTTTANNSTSSSTTNMFKSFINSLNFKADASTSSKNKTEEIYSKLRKELDEYQAKEEKKQVERQRKLRMQYKDIMHKFRYRVDMRPKSLISNLRVELVLGLGMLFFAYKIFSHLSNEEKEKRKTSLEKSGIYSNKEENEKAVERHLQLIREKDDPTTKQKRKYEKRIDF